MYFENLKKKHCGSGLFGKGSCQLQILPPNVLKSVSIGAVRNVCNDRAQFSETKNTQLKIYRFKQ